MKTQFKGILIFSLLLLYSFSLKGQTGRFYTTDKGLSSSLINQIYQDSRGFIWIATEYGLNRFDGLHFVNYWHTSDDSLSIKNNYVCAFFEDAQQNLLIGCINGLMKYDRETDAFISVPLVRSGKKVSAHVTQMQELHNGAIWIATTGQGMFCLDEEHEKAISVDDLLQLSNFKFQSCLYEDSYYNIWIGTYGNGLICYRPTTKDILVFKSPMINDNNIAAIIEDKQGNLFVGTQKQGMSRYDRKENRFIPVPYLSGKALSVYSMSLVDNQLLVGTDGQGLKIYDPIDQTLKDYVINTAPTDFSDGKIHSILEDKDQNLWLGLFQKGMVLIPKQDNPFEYYGNKSVHYNPIGQGCVMSIYQDSNHRLWVGTDNEGLYELDGKTGKRLRHFVPGNSAHSIANTIMCMYEDSENNFWVGSYTRGLAKLNRLTGDCEYPLPIDNEKIFSIVEDRHKKLYIGTLGSGFYQFNLLTGKLKHYISSGDEIDDWTRNELPNDWINSLFCDSEGLIWLGHYKGVSCFNPLTANFVNFNKVNTLITGCVGYSILQDSAGKIWAGTTDGLYSFNKKTGNLLRLATANGLSNNVICGLCEDSYHNIWMSTYMGISKYDKQSGQFINYYSGDGLQGNEFTHGAFFKDKNGKIYFGGINGITSFYPKDIERVSKSPAVCITDFYIFDRPVRKNTLSGGEPVVYTSVQDADFFQLSYHDNTFSVVFSTLQYNNPEQISYQYKIEELSSRWLTTEPGVNRVTYNNLPPGKYTFQVRKLAYGDDSKIRTIKILISPPWYQTWWAYFIYVALLGLLILGIVNQIRSRMHHRRDMMKREHAEQLNEAKLQFFINISHEIRTPMTLIISPLEKLLAETKDRELQKKYLMIYRNSQRILRLINQLMDIRRLDKGQMFMKFRETDIVGFINDVMQTFEYLGQKKNIRFSFEHSMAQLKVWIDLNNFDKVLMNILSNAFKYTPEGGEIQVSLSVGQEPSRHDALRDYFEIAITDNGIGIDHNKVERIFERFYQIDNDVTKSNFGTGIGLHLSRSLVELHHGVLFAENRVGVPGSRFIIRLPLGSAHLRKDEFETVDTDTMMAQLASKVPVPNLDVELMESEPNVSLPKAKTGIRLLIVEDEEEIRAYLKSELSSEYKIETCSNGREAYDMILRDTPDLVLSDIMMPEMDGLTLCRKLKQNTNVNHIPVILLTAKTKPEDTLEGMGIGADAYIVKPFHLELLRSTIDNLIANRKLLRNKFSGAQEQTDKMDLIKMKSSDEILMNKIMKVVNEHLDDPALNVERLAAEVGLSRVHIHRKLKELTNLSARDFIKNIRLQQAAHLLLQEHKLSISEIAYATGYTNLSHFSSSFREKYGMSPKEYMNKPR